MNRNTDSRPSTPNGAAGHHEGIFDQVKQAASHVAEQTRETVSSTISSTIDTQKGNAADRLEGVAGALRRTGDQLKDEEMGGPLPNLADTAADAIERAAEFIQSRTIGEVLGDVEGFARREPAIFLGAAFALGLVGGRFLRASGRNAPASMRSSGGAGHEGDLDMEGEDGGYEGFEYDDAGDGRHAAGSEGGSGIEEMGATTAPMTGVQPVMKTGGPARENTGPIGSGQGGGLGGGIGTGHASSAGGLGGAGTGVSTDTSSDDTGGRITDPFGSNAPGDTKIGLGPGAGPRRSPEKKE